MLEAVKNIPSLYFASDDMFSIHFEHNESFPTGSRLSSL